MSRLGRHFHHRARLCRGMGATRALSARPDKTGIQAKKYDNVYVGLNGEYGGPESSMLRFDFTRQRRSLSGGTL